MEEDIYEIVAACLAGEELSSEERVKLEQWRRVGEHEGEYERLRKIAACGVAVRGCDSIRGEGAYGRIMRQVERKRSEHPIQKRVWIYSAASVLLLMGVITLLMFSRFEGEVFTRPLTNQILPGTAKARLTLANGQEIELNCLGNGVIVEDSLLHVRNDASTLIYSSEKTPMEMEYNTLSVPDGAEYNLVLADGTNVFMNSGSKLRYPVVFTGMIREVYLSGEAYFEVTKDAARAFVVHAEQMAIRVLGTSFNVNAYPGQPTISATLEEGRIQVVLADREFNVKPGERFLYDSKNQVSEIREVDTELYTSWKSGYYKFEGTPLHEIMSTLALWYNLDIFYQNPEVKEIEFTGRLRRYDNVMELLKKFEQTREVEFIIKERSVTIKRK